MPEPSLQQRLYIDAFAQGVDRGNVEAGMCAVIRENAHEHRGDVVARKGELQKPQARQHGIALLGGDGDGQERLDGLAVFEQAYTVLLIDLVVVKLLHIAGGKPILSGGSFGVDSSPVTILIFGAVALLFWNAATRSNKST